jgi:hypothetical protein
VLRSPSFEAPNALDAQFSALVHDIQQRLALLARAPTIRVEKWLRKLHDPVSNVTWKKLRNDYARLLRHNLSLGATSPPFDKAPDDGPLRNLLPDEKARFKGDGFGDAKNGAAKKKQSASSKTLFDASSTKTKTKATTSYDGVLDETEAETALRDLLRRANVAGAPRPLGAAEIATAVPPPLQGLFEDDSANPFADVDRVAYKTTKDTTRLGCRARCARSSPPRASAEVSTNSKHPSPRETPPSRMWSPRSAPSARSAKSSSGVCDARRPRWRRAGGN